MTASPIQAWAFLPQNPTTNTDCTAGSLDRMIETLVHAYPDGIWDAETLADKLDWPSVWEVLEAIDRLCVAGKIGRME